MKFLGFICFILIGNNVFAQQDRWQQSVKYVMSIDVDETRNRFTGKQKLEYTNNSPDKLGKVFYHLYWNAFQPNSMMDVRSLELGKTLINGRPDWDPRVKDRISKLTESEIGYQKIISLKMNGVPQTFEVHETILEVTLTSPIQPKSKVNFEMEFEAQVPLQVRRSGRDNAEGIKYSMSQWYPKLCEYDYEGWHPTPYIAREFYGVWGNYDVIISIEKNFKLGGTGVLQNASEIGWGYDKEGTALKAISKAKRQWHFIANNVHDFVWAADTAYAHLVRKVGPVTINVIYKNVDSLQKAWQNVADAAVTVLPYIEQRFGKYPYPQYSFIQGGDGGMEYPMATLIKSAGLGTVFHEWMHSWYQMMLATNESLHPWMDEGFASFAEEEVSAFYKNKISPQSSLDTSAAARAAAAALPKYHNGAYRGYFALVRLKLEEPLTTHADHYNTNFAYSISSYSKGEIFLVQLGYIVGDKVRDKILQEYYKLWRFKHPNASDFIKVAEEVSGLKLDWYKEFWITSTKSIDYGIDSLWEENGVAKIRIKRIGLMPMPIDVQLTFKDGTREIHTMPLNLMYGSKSAESIVNTVNHDEWKWTNPIYTFDFEHKLTDLKSVEIDPTKRLADIDQANNVLQLNW
ncbi:MAG: M1 family metallopeptidase [Ginsengibacter sp.]